jgi:hypothetical protein
MSYHLLNFDNQEINFDFENFIIGRKIPIDNDLSKYYIYYQDDENTAPKEIYLKVPILRLIYSLSNLKYNQINIPVYPKWSKTARFVEWIESFENNIIECFSNKKISKEFISLISKKKLLNFLKIGLGITPDYKITSTLKENLILSDFKINSQIQIILKINHIWQKGTKMGLSSQLYQIHYIPTPEQLGINFLDDDKPFIKNMPLLKNITPPPPPPPPPLPINHNIPEKTNMKFCPTMADLQSALKKLKKT